MAGYFDRLDEFACEVRRINGVSISVNPNPVRGENRGKLRNNLGYLGRGAGASIDDILCLRWILIDIDPTERKGNSTAAEHEACSGLMRSILDGEPAIEVASLRGSSGNGAYILVRVEMENTDQDRDVVGTFQKALGRKYRTARAAIDTQWNPTKLVGLPGSLKCKYPHSAERPRRVVGCEPLDSPREFFDVRAWLDANSVPVAASPPRFHTPAGPVLSPAAPRPQTEQDDIRQAQDWLRKRPGAIEGQGGGSHTYATICTVMHGWELSEADTLRLIIEWNVTCRPPWTDYDLQRMIRDAATDRRHGTGFMRAKRRRARQPRPRRYRGIGPSTFPVFDDSC